MHQKLSYVLFVTFEVTILILIICMHCELKYKKKCDIFRFLTVCNLKFFRHFRVKIIFHKMLIFVALWHYNNHATIYLFIQTFITFHDFPNTSTLWYARAGVLNNNPLSFLISISMHIKKKSGGILAFKIQNAKFFYFIFLSCAFWARNFFWQPFEMCIPAFGFHYKVNRNILWNQFGKNIMFELPTLLLFVDFEWKHR